ncbi:hypothetical protein M7I_0522 [Glarea lozoyensis 74030]|uniref:Fibronectin type-III domain-containing protein n=1 Tax=Glarea lozoyensis (strain ATCC 74030 / MF5533) TaxID=1104152 RepID=H0EDR7_GLAL7|nr:hypothetical protein M7I_0522 [Glarea lozoyensis 74030]
MSHLAVIEGRKLPDNYAWYATAMWYRQFYGDPDSASITATAPEDDAVDYFEDDGSDPLPAEFDNPDYDEISEAEAIAFAAGDYTPSGWLKNKKLRILPLGDSITSGVQSSDGNGYRKDLLNILEVDPASAPQRLDSLVGKLVAACPDATIIVSRIIPSSNGGTASLIKPFNKAVAEFMAQRAIRSVGSKILVVREAQKTQEVQDRTPASRSPSRHSAAWVRLLSYNSDKVSVLVANILNGPDYVLDKAWKSVIDQAASQGKKVIGYIRTGYLGIEQDVDKWYELYGSSLGGIFFDEGWPECGPNNIYADVYAYINNYTKRKYPGAFTVLNPGSPIAQCFENTMDTLLTFENSYEAYQSEYTPNDWTPKDPRKIWHIIFQVPQGQIAGVAALASSRHAGFVEITDDTQPNPYDNLPNEAYMQALIGAVAGGKPRAADPATFSGSYVAGLPADAAVSSSDYSSVTLTWSSVGSALGYAVYKNGVRVVELPPFMTRATIAMLEPGTSGMTFEVRTILATGSGGQSRSLSGSTKSLPSTGTVSNVGFTTDGNTATYKADVLVPYGFVRLFLGIKQPDPGIGRGWPIHSPALGGPSGETAFHQIVNYLVEGYAPLNNVFKGTLRHYGSV